MMARWRTVLAVLAGAATYAAGVAGCDQAGQSPGELTIGLLVPQTGPYKAIGDDMRRGFELYLEQHGGRLGGRPIRLVVADEADGGAAVRGAVDKLLKADRASVIVGTANASAVSTLAGAITDARVPFVGVGGRPSTLADVRYIWHTSFASTDYGKAIARHVKETVGGPVYVIGPDYQGGKDQIGGFVTAYTAAGGRLANPGGKPTHTPWPATENFAPWLSRVADTGATAVYAFYAGAPAVGFVKQYRQFIKDLPLYGPGFLTEGAALAAEGEAADGIYTVMPYAPGLENPTNTAFATALAGKHRTTPNLYHVTSYDAAAVLDSAIAAAGADPTPEAINNAIAGLGEIDSPRGKWRFGPTNHTPIQPWYLRQVVTDAGTRTNAVVRELGTFGD